MLKHRNAKKALLDIIDELEKSQKDIEEKKPFLGFDHYHRRRGIILGDSQTSYQQFWSEVRKLIKERDVSDADKIALLAHIDVLENGRLDRLAAANITDEIIKRAPWLRKTFEQLVTSDAGSMLPREILDGIKFALGF
ncbi:hypothetical protein H8E77_22315 [bacterium]|nr:hypothetical protein [bacterium]